MDSTVIQEIANQLGLAVDKTGEFIAEQLPNFAQLQILKAIPLPAGLWLIFAIAIAVAIISRLIYGRKYKAAIEEYHDKLDKYEKENSDKPTSQFMIFSPSIPRMPDKEDFLEYWVMLGASAVAAFFIVFSIAATFCAAFQIIGWSNYPEAMLLDMAMKAVG